uniref:Uncharacterized protein n=1 Tax=Oryza punctata TaxID=4537 RepID=A0A0E0M0I1_ORYPU
MEGVRLVVAYMSSRRCQHEEARRLWVKALPLRANNNDACVHRFSLGTLLTTMMIYATEEKNKVWPCFMKVT